MQIRACFVIFIILVGSPWPDEALAQDYSRIEKFKAQLTHDPIAEKPKTLNRIAFEYRTSFPDSAIAYARQSIRLAKDIGREATVAESENLMGLANMYLGRQKEALQHYSVAKALAEAADDSVQWGMALNNTGRLLVDNANLTKGYQALAQAQAIFTRLNHQEGLGYVYRSLSDLFLTQHDYENALKMAKKALEVRQLLRDQRGIISANEQIGKIYQLMQDYADAENAWRDAEAIAGELEDEASLAEIKLGLGDLYYRNGSYSKAMTEAFRANTMVQRLKSPLLVSRSDLLLGQLLLKEKKYVEALPYLQRALSTAQALRQLPIMTEANFYLAKWYELQGRYAQGSAYETRYRALNDSLKNNELALQAQKFNFQIEMEKSNRENDLLKSKEAENQAIIRFQKLLNYGSAFVVALISIFTYFIWRSSKARKRINALLAWQNTKLSELNHEKDSLMGVVAHDLKTPLANIHSMTELVRNMGALNPRQDEFVSLIKTSTQEGLELIKELLDIHKLESAVDPELKPVDVASLLLHRATAFHPLAQAKSIDLVTKFDVTETIHADEEWLGRCLDNLISNAIKFSPPHARVVVSSGINRDLLWISVKDNGPGFSPEDKRNVFQKFKRLSARPTGGESSNGLGLSIVKKLVERMHGTVTLLSELGHGAEFIIQLPMRRLDAA